MLHPGMLHSRVGSGLTHKDSKRLEKLATDKRSSLLQKLTAVKRFITLSTGVLMHAEKCHKISSKIPLWEIVNASVFLVLLMQNQLLTERTFKWCFNIRTHKIHYIVFFSNIEIMHLTKPVFKEGSDGH